MSEMVETEAAVALPPTIISKADLSRMIVELERVDSELTTKAVHERVGAESTSPSPISQQLTDFLQRNELELSDATIRTQLITDLHKLKDTVPIVHMTFAAEADPESLGQIVQWLRHSVHPQAVIEVGLQPGLVAGVYMRTTNSVIDLSLRGALQHGREILTKELEALRVNG